MVDSKSRLYTITKKKWKLRKIVRPVSDVERNEPNREQHSRHSVYEQSSIG